MPLMKPEIQAILRKAGLAGPIENAAGPEGESQPRGRVTEILDRAGLSLDETIELLAQQVMGGTNEALRHKSLETVLKMHGVLKDTAVAAQMPSFTIVIQDAGHEAPLVNPILLPRQLHNTLREEKEKETVQ